MLFVICPPGSNRPRRAISPLPMDRITPHRAGLLALCALLASGCASSGPAEPVTPVVIRPTAVASTEPVDVSGDAADDAAIYVHPYAPERSLILGTNKKAGLMVFDLSGRLLQTVSPTSRPNNVHVMYAVRGGGGGTFDLAAAGGREPDRFGLRFWRIDPFSGTLTDITRNGFDPVLGGDEPYGTCLYRSARDDRRYVFVNGKSGAVEQRELVVHPDGTVSSELRRTFSLPSQVEGMVADDELGFVYVSEEAVGVWRFGAEPDDGTTGVLIARVGENGLTADTEGIALYRGAAGTGFLIVSSQGSSDFKVYDRRPPHRFLATLRPEPTDRFPAPRDTDGLVAESAPLGKTFPKGLLVVQDGAEPPRKQDFKIYNWADIAGDLPPLRPAPSPRLAPARIAPSP